MKSDRSAARALIVHPADESAARLSADGRARVYFADREGLGCSLKISTVGAFES